MKNIATYVLWTMSVAFMIMLFWGLIGAMNGDVPVVSGVQITQYNELSMPIALSRWWDILIALIWVPLLVPFLIKPSYYALPYDFRGAYLADRARTIVSISLVWAFMQSVVAKSDISNGIGAIQVYLLCVLMIMLLVIFMEVGRVCRYLYLMVLGLTFGLALGNGIVLGVLLLSVVISLRLIVYVVMNYKTMIAWYHQWCMARYGQKIII